METEAIEEREKMEDLVRSLSQLCVVIGTQWGDEGKGNIVDILAQRYDIMVRCQGGENAGHTIYNNEENNFVLYFSTKPRNINMRIAKKTMKMEYIMEYHMEKFSYSVEIFFSTFKSKYGWYST